MNINNAFPSKYLKSGDVPADSDLLLTIDSVTMETVGQGEQAEQKPIIYFRETDKGLVLNKTNAGTIAQLHGPETDAWAGKRIALFCTEVDFAGKQTLALRVRLRAPAVPSANGQSAKEKWEAWCAEHDITKADVKAALDTELVNEWLKANKQHGATLDDAMRQILAVKTGPVEEPF